MIESEAQEIYVDYWHRIKDCQLNKTQLDFVCDEDRFFVKEFGIPWGKQVLYFNLNDLGKIRDDGADVVLSQTFAGKPKLVYNSGSVFSYEVDERYIIEEFNPTLRYKQKKVLWSSSLKKFLLCAVLVDIMGIKAYENDEKLLDNEPELDKALSSLQISITKVQPEIWNGLENPWLGVIWNIKGPV